MVKVCLDKTQKALTIKKEMDKYGYNKIGAIHLSKTLLREWRDERWMGEDTGNTLND